MAEWPEQKPLLSAKNKMAGFRAERSIVFDRKSRSQALRFWNRQSCVFFIFFYFFLQKCNYFDADEPLKQVYLRKRAPFLFDFFGCCFLGT